MDKFFKELWNLTFSKCERPMFLFSRPLFSLRNNNDFFERITKLKNNNGHFCPKCHSQNIIKHGKSNDKQRFRCKDCGKTFNNSTFTPLYWTHYPEKWPLFIECMIRGFSLRQCESIVHVSYVTLFYWRHKVLSALKQLAYVSKFKNIVEIADLCLPYSEKGCKKIKNRDPRKTGVKKFIYGIDLKVSIITAIDSYGNISSNSVYIGEHYYIPSKILDNLIGKYLDSSNILCTKNIRYYKWYSYYKKLKHCIVSNTSFDDKANIHNVLDFNEKFNTWIYNFKGVSSKYLNNYLGWFKYLNSIKFEDSIENITDMLLKSCSCDVTETWDSLRNYKMAV